MMHALAGSLSTRILVLILAVMTIPVSAADAAPFELEKGDHIVYLGNGLADRMQHHGWLETIIQSARPELELVFRNHGFAGDTVTDRPRSKDFPSPDEYLTLSKASVIFAFFGYNESFANKPDEFAKQLGQWIDDTRKKNYSGNGAPRIVLFSPIGHEDLHSPNLPDGQANNVRLAAYTHAMSEVAKQKNVAFVNLYHPSLALYQKSKQPLTLNGIHLTEEGNRQLAEVIAHDLLGIKAPAASEATEKLRQAVLDKNWHWFNRYRATDGNDIWGSRADLKFVDGQTNRVVLQRELEQLDLMTANRDRRIWAVARGGDMKVDDSNVPPAVPVKTNYKPSNKNGTLEFLSGTEAIKKMKMAKGLKANLFADEAMFPELANPVQMAVDTKGRLWVAAWKDYPKWEPTKTMEDRLLILPDENRDGVADKAITFAKVHNPTGFEFWNGGVLVASAPDILFLKDTDGDDVADVRIRVLHGIDSADTHHTANNFVYGPDGGLYYQRGVFHVSNVETPWGPPHKSTTNGMYRFNPRTYEFSFHASNGPNPHGSGFDYWGYNFATDGTTGRSYQVVPDSKSGFTMRKLLEKKVRPVPSSGVLSSAHLPEQFEGNFLIANAIGFLGIKQYRLDYDVEKGEVNGVELEDFMTSSDPNFRPTDFEVGDDGAVYVSDWQNPLIGHMQHNIRDPSRDKKHGRIYRFVYEGRPLAEHVAIDGEPINKLLDLLKSPYNSIRYRVRIELSERPTKDVIAATEKWIKQWNPTRTEHAHHLLEALWVYQQHNVVNKPLLELLLSSPEPNARQAAMVVERLWRNSNKLEGDMHDMHAMHKKHAAAAGGHDEKPMAEIKDDKDTIVIHTVPEQMKYDKTEFTVKAGQPVKLRLVNPDYMPHNIVIGQPGSAEEIGTAAEQLGAKGFELGFVPPSQKIIVASKLIDHQKSELLTFTAPSKPGDYDYICTFPGHWRLMRGVMKVVP
ncbi:hypothetical protein HED60_12480 [Planctomycetales bacterium ZRK34]|nr:hypothetical protein HED60_12480 [Planctomycetales bacterium ZRK34]